MFSERALASQTVDVGLVHTDSSGVPQTDGVFNYAIFRQSDGAQFDFSDSTFGGTITTPTQALTQIGTTSVFSHRLDLSAITNHATAKDTFYVVFTQTGGTAISTLPRHEIVVNPDDMIAVAYADGIHAQTGGSAGTTIGRDGTARNYASVIAAKTIADLLNIKRYKVHGGAFSISGGGLDFTDMEVIGVGSVNVFNPATLSVDGSRFTNMFINGTFADGDTVSGDGCTLGGTTNLPNGEWRDVHLEGEQTLKGGGDFVFRNVTAIPYGPARTKIDVTACTSTCDLLIAGLKGKLEVEGHIGTFTEYQISMAGGHVVIDASNTGGTIVLTGVGTYTDEGGGVTVDASGLVDPRKIDRNASLIELQRGAHTFQPTGKMWHVSPNDGNDSTGDGSQALPFATIQKAIDKAVDGRHDVVKLVADLGSDVTEFVVTSAINCNKRYTFIRGPGGDVRVRRSNSGDVFNVTADGVELSGFRIETHSVGNGRCVDVSASDFVRVRKLQLDESRGDGIRVINGSYCQIHDNILRNVGSGGASNGIHVTSTGVGGLHNHVENNRIYDTAGDGIQVSNVNSRHTVVRGNLVCGSTGWGITIASGPVKGHIIDNMLSNNDSGNTVDDSGTDTELHNNGHYATETALTAVAVDTTLVRQIGENRLEIDFTAQTMILYGDDDVTPLRTWPLETNAGGADVVTTRAGVQAKRKPTII